MSKLSFRARALDPSKQMPIYLAEELPDLPEYSAINRAVPQMPSGMEKEEESEHHLQRAICTGLIIPTPEVFTTDQDFYDQGYPPNYKMPRQMIHMQPLGLEQDVPDYDMDSADEAWVNQQSRRLDMTPLKFEQMMDRLEKSSGQTVVTLNEAKALLKQDDEVSIAVYDYWLNKRLKMQHPLILSVKTENRPGASSNNPYLAFRRRTEKMQTRKNRKNDETSYEKMLKLRRDLQRATTMLEMVKRREKTKREQLHLSIEIFEKRVQLRDFSGAILSELSASFKSSRPAFAPLYTNQYSHHTSSSGSTPTGGVPGCAAAAGIGGALAPGLLAAGVNSSGTTASGGHLYSSASQYLNSSSLAIDAVNAGVSGSRKEKRQYKKRKHKLPRDKQQQQQQQQYLAGVGVVPASATTATAAVASSLSAHHHAPLLLHLHRQSSSPAANESNIETEEEEFASGSGQHAQKVGSESEDEATFAFRRKQSCSYLKPLEHDGSWPWEPKEDDGFGDPKYRFTLTSIRHPRPRCIGFARRRLGRGGRVILDRVATDLDDFWSKLDYTIFESGPNAQKHSNKETNAKPASPPTVVDLPTNNAAMATAAAPTPANKIKTEPIEEKDASKLLVSDDDGVEADFDDDYAEHEECVARADSNISRDAIYSSALTLMRRQRYRMRKRLQRLKEKLYQQDDAQATKRPKFNDAMPPSQTGKEQPLPRKLLHQLALSLERNSSMGGGLCDILSFGEMVKREQLKSDALADEVVVVDLVQQEQYQQQQTNPRFNNNMLNNNNNSCSNINKNVSVSDKDKFNVIKLKMEADAEEEDLSLADTAMAAAIATTTTTIKQELNDAVSVASADDSNEPLSSIQKHSVAAATTAAMDIMVDEDNVNLAQLSSLMRHTVKKEPVDVMTQDVHCNLSPLKEQQLCSSVDDDEHTSTLNQVEDVVRLRNIRNSRHAKQHIASTISVLIQDEEQQAAEDYISSLSPSSSQRLDVCNELLSEIRRDWLHFRPKTPTDELSESDDCKLPSLLDDVPRTSMVDWSQETPIAVEMLTVPADESRQHKHASLWDVNAVEGLFVSSSFNYAELEPDTQLLQAAYMPPEVVRSRTKSPESGAAGNSNSGLDFNLSGDSLNDINLLGDGDETDENMLENILQECQIDDIKTLNQATTFWNGILDGEAVDEVSAADVETAAGLLDCMDSSEKKPRDACGAGGNRGSAMRAKCGRLRNCGSAVFGSSNFSSTAPTVLRDEFFFKADQPMEKVSAAIDTVKMESSVPLLTHLSQTPTAASASQSTTALVATTVTQSATAITPQVLQFVSGTPQQQVLLQAPQQPAQLQQQQQLPKVPATLSDIMGVSTAAAPTQLQIQSQQQQQQIVQLQPPQVRSVAVQQFHQLQPQHQFLQQMQRDLVSSSPAIMAHYVPTTSSAPVVASASATTLRQQPTLTPIGSTASGNHMIYTTSGDGTAGPQKIYIQKAPGTVVATHASSAQLTAAATQVPNSGLSTNAAVITLSNVKLESDGSQTATLVGQQSAGGANILTLDGSGSVTVTSSVTSAPSVSIISTASGQQVAVHNIGGVQNMGTTAGGNGGVHMSTAPTPLIVTTATRNAQQQLVHGQAAQQIVWRQIGTTNATGVLTTTTEAAAAMAAGNNKIVWASRPGQKRQLNGPEGATDINKLLLNRKFSQRRIISQHNTQLQQQQHQIQITKQHLQQLQQHRLQQQQQFQQLQQQQLDDDSNTHVVNSSVGMLESASVNVATASPQQQQAVQKVQMQSGKVIKMPPFPLLVSEVHMKAQQQLQHNSAAVAANHNYSLQPTAIITSQSAQQNTASNKIFLTSSSNNSGVGGSNAATNFTIATTAGELQAATTLSTQKIQYKDLQNSNLKVNFVSTGMVGGGGSSTGVNAGSGVQSGSIVVDTKTVVMAQQQQHQQQTVLLNKAAATSMQQRQLLQQQKRILNIIGAASVDANASGVANAVSVSGATPDNSKRVLYTSLLNVKPLPKNNAGQMQVQLGQSGMAHAVLRGRIGNNQTIYTTNMRTVPIAATTSVGGSVGHVQVATSSSMAVAAAANATNTVAGTQAMATSASTATTAAVTVEAVATLSNTMVIEGKSLENVTSNNNGGLAMLTAGGCNALSNNSSNGSSAGGGSNNAMATTTTTNNTGASATINR